MAIQKADLTEGHVRVSIMSVIISIFEDVVQVVSSARRAIYIASQDRSGPGKGHAFLYSAEGNFSPVSLEAEGSFFKDATFLDVNCSDGNCVIASAESCRGNGTVFCEAMAVDVECLRR